MCINISLQSYVTLPYIFMLLFIYNHVLHCNAYVCYYLFIVMCYIMIHSYVTIYIRSYVTLRYICMSLFIYSHASQDICGNRRQQKRVFSFLTSELYMKMKCFMKEESQIAVNVIKNLRSKTTSINI